MTALTLNFGYLRTNEGMVVCGEVLAAIIGMICNIFWGGLPGILLWIAFWLTFIVSGMIFLLSLCGAYLPMLNKFNILIWLERGYIVLSLILYLIATILSFVVWGLSSLFAYGLVVLYVLHGLLRWKTYRNSLGTPPPADVNT